MFAPFLGDDIRRRTSASRSVPYPDSLCCPLRSVLGRPLVAFSPSPLPPPFFFLPGPSSHPPPPPLPFRACPSAGHAKGWGPLLLSRCPGGLTSCTPLADPLNPRDSRRYGGGRDEAAGGGRDELAGRTVGLGGFSCVRAPLRRSPPSMFRRPGRTKPHRPSIGRGPRLVHVLAMALCRGGGSAARTVWSGSLGKETGGGGSMNTAAIPLQPFAAPPFSE